MAELAEHDDGPDAGQPVTTFLPGAITTSAGTTRFSTYPNKDAPFVLAYICNVCGQPSIAFGGEIKGQFTGTCPHGHDAIVQTRR